MEAMTWVFGVAVFSARASVDQDKPSQSWRTFCSPYMAGTRGFLAHIRHSAQVVNVHVAKVLPYSSVTARSVSYKIVKQTFSMTLHCQNYCIESMPLTLQGNDISQANAYLIQDAGQRGLYGST